MFPCRQLLLLLYRDRDSETLWLDLPIASGTPSVVKVHCEIGEGRRRCWRRGRLLLLNKACNSGPSSRSQIYRAIPFPHSYNRSDLRLYPALVTPGTSAVSLSLTLFFPQLRHGFTRHFSPLSRRSQVNSPVAFLVLNAYFRSYSLISLPPPYMTPLLWHNKHRMVYDPTGILQSQRPSEPLASNSRAITVTTRGMPLNSYPYGCDVTHLPNPPPPPL